MHLMHLCPTMYVNKQPFTPPLFCIYMYQIICKVIVYMYITFATVCYYIEMLTIYFQPWQKRTWKIGTPSFCTIIPEVIIHENATLRSSTSPMQLVRVALHLHLHLIFAEARRAEIIAAKDKMSVKEAIQIFPQIDKDSLLSGFILLVCFFSYVEFLYPII